VWPFSRSKEKKNTAAKPAASAATQPAQRYDAVEVVPAAYGACPAVLELAGKRFLSNRIPKLPLPECDRATCDCGYRRHKDRRAGQRRAADLYGARPELAQARDADDGDGFDPAATIVDLYGPKPELQQEREDRRDPAVKGRRRFDR
jgi:hypothetical protein